MVGDLLQPTHLLFVLVVALLVLGPKRLPEVGRALGRGLRDFRSAISGEEPAERTITPAQQPEASSSTPVPPPADPQAANSSTTPSEPQVRPPDTVDHPAEPATDSAEPATSSQPVAASKTHDSAA